MPHYPATELIAGPAPYIETSDILISGLINQIPS